MCATGWTGMMSEMVALEPDDLNSNQSSLRVMWYELH